MASRSPSTAWSGFFDHSSLGGGGGLHGESELSWSKGFDGTLDKLDDFESNIIHDHGVASSAASSSSESDCFPIGSMHHMPAWGTEHSDELSAGNLMSRAISSDLFHQTSPGDAISPSGILDTRQNGQEATDDTWFIPSPETGALPVFGHSLQRKKRIHFAAGNGLPSSSASGSLDLENGIGSPGAANNALKAHKSVPNLNGRRISSGYTARLEDLLAEMGWPKNAQTEGEGESSDLGDTTIQGVNAAADATTLSSFSSNGSLASGMPQHSSSSALYQRRAGSREGLMPTPTPVSIPKRAEDGGGNTAPSTANGEQMDADQQRSHTRTRSNTVETLSNLAAVQNSMTQQRAAALIAQQQRLQQMSVSMSQGAGSEPQQQVEKEQKRAKTESVGASPSSISPNQQMLFASPSSGGSMRPATASSGSNTTELPTPITPFVGLSLGNGQVDNLQWQNPHGFMFGAGSSAEVALMQQYALQQKKENGTLTDDYLTNLNNSLGLCGVPSVTAPPSVINPTAVLDPATFSSMFGTLPASMTGTPLSAGLPPSQSVLQSPAAAHNGHVTPTHAHQYQQRLIFPPQQQKVVPVGTSAFNTRPRAGTAMAALGSGAQNGTPRHMRSTPNMTLSPSASMDGSQYSMSVASTPVKSLRKIASNRRLNGMAGVTPDSPAHTFAEMPSSPMSPSKRRAGTLSASRSMGNLGAAVSSSMPASSSTFEFINYGIEDADELCSAVAPSGSYKVPLKGYGEEGEEEDDDEAGATYDAASPGTDTESLTRSPRRTGLRRARSSTNRSGPRWEDPNAPPLPNQAADSPGARSLKRQKSEQNMMLSGRRKSPSMSNLRRAA